MRNFFSKNTRLLSFSEDFEDDESTCKSDSNKCNLDGKIFNTQSNLKNNLKNSQKFSNRSHCNENLKNNSPLLLDNVEGKCLSNNIDLIQDSHDYDDVKKSSYQSKNSIREKHKNSHENTTNIKHEFLGIGDVTKKRFASEIQIQKMKRHRSIKNNIDNGPKNVENQSSRLYLHDSCCDTEYIGYSNHESDLKSHDDRINEDLNDARIIRNNSFTIHVGMAQDIGKRLKMEDKIVIRIPLMNLNDCKSTEQGKADANNAWRRDKNNFDKCESSVLRPTMYDGSYESNCGLMSYFAIFDGHNGSGTSDYAGDNLHKIILNQMKTCDLTLSRQESYGEIESIDTFSKHSSSKKDNFKGSKVNFDAIKVNESDDTIENYVPLYHAFNTNIHQNPDFIKKFSKSQNPSYRHNYARMLQIMKILNDSFIQLDRDYLRDNPFSTDGSTALVCIQEGSSIHFAHVGDSRAVLATYHSGHDDCINFLKGCDGKTNEIVQETEYSSKKQHAETRTDQHGYSKLNLSKEKVRAVKLTNDHKPDRFEERVRIRSNGGQIIHLGCPRVGVNDINCWLAVSRAFGDFAIKRAARNVITCEPEYNYRKLIKNKDLFIIMASDGLWDVYTDQEACDIVSKYLSKNADTINCTDDDMSIRRLFDDAAKYLVQSAIMKGSLDNLSCIILKFFWKD